MGPYPTDMTELFQYNKVQPAIVPHTFADDNTFSSFTTTAFNLVRIQQ